MGGEGRVNKKELRLVSVGCLKTNWLYKIVGMKMEEGERAKEMRKVKDRLKEGGRVGKKRRNNPIHQ